MLREDHRSNRGRITQLSWKISWIWIIVYKIPIMDNLARRQGTWPSTAERKQVWQTIFWWPETSAQNHFHDELGWRETQGRARRRWGRPRRRWRRWGDHVLQVCHVKARNQILMTFFTVSKSTSPPRSFALDAISMMKKSAMKLRTACKMICMPFTRARRRRREEF